MTLILGQSKLSEGKSIEMMQIYIYRDDDYFDKLWNESENLGYAGWNSIDAHSFQQTRILVSWEIMNPKQVKIRVKQGNYCVVVREI